MAKDIVTGVLITSLIFFISIFIPFFGFVGALFIPLPILYYRIKLGRATGATIAMMSSLVMILIISELSLDALFFIELLLIGFVLGELIELNLSIEKTILYASSSVLTAGFVGLLLFSILSGKGIFAIVSLYITKNLELTMAFYQHIGMSEENVQLVLNSLDKIQYVLVRIIPALVTGATLFVVWTSILLAKPILKNKSLFYPDYGPLNMWKAPEFLVSSVIGCGLVLFLPNTTVKMIALNALMILMTVYFFQGIAIVSFYFEKKRFPRIIRIFLYTLIALQQIILLAVIGLGFFDLWVNFRRLGKETN